MLRIYAKEDYKKQGKTLSDALASLYATYGFYGERVVDIYMEGLDGIEKRRRVMESLRNNPPRDIGGVTVISIGDYKDGTVTVLADGSTSPTGQPMSDVLYYTLTNEDKIIFRPSGTEPKIKIYMLAHDTSSESLEAKIENYAVCARAIADV